jgi:F0F1-type ATP synthase membrane subunit b/b'
MKRRLQWAALGMLVLLAVALPVHASEEGGGDNLFTAPIGWVFRWIQFIVVFGGVGYLLAKKAPAYFRRRAETIVASITESTKVKEEAERQLREAEEKLRRLDQELAEMRHAAQREAAAEAERIRKATQDEAKKIERAAQAEVGAAERAARIELKALAARLAVERAEALIRKQMTPQTEAALLQSFMQNLAGPVPAGGGAVGPGKGA